MSAQAQTEVEKAGTSNLANRIHSVPAWIWLTLLTVAVLGPFIGKAFHIDDPLFLWTARQIQKHPGDFYGFNVNWFGTSMSAASETICNPPVASAYIAVAASFLGWSEPALHLAFLLPALAAVLGMYFLAGYYCSRPMLATVAVVLTPIFIISATTLMCDVPMLAGWIWAMVLWEKGLRDNRTGCLLWAGGLVGICIWTKFAAITLVPLLGAYALMKKRGPGAWVGALMIPVLFMAGYELITRRLYGHGLFLSAANYASSVVSPAEVGLIGKQIIGISFIGGCFLPFLFYADWLWPRRPMIMIGALTMLIVSWWLRHAPGLGHAVTNMDGTVNRRMLLQVAFFIIGGVNLFLLVVLDFWRCRDAVSAMLALWVLGTFFFGTSVNWTMNGRSLLPMAPAAGILLARRVEQNGIRKTREFAWPLLAAGGFSLYLGWADCCAANSSRDAAKELCAKYQPHQRQVWFEGHWGFQYYMEELGAMMLDFRASKLSAGQIIVLPSPSNHTQVFDLPGELFRYVETLDLPPRVQALTMSRWADAGFYATRWGSLPYALCKSETDRYFVFEVIRPYDFAANPLVEELKAGGVLDNHAHFLTESAACQRALLSNPDDAEAHFRFGKLLTGYSQDTEAARQFAEVLRIQPDDGPAHFQMGLLLENGDAAAAIAHYRAALQAMPDSVEAMNNLAWLLSTTPAAQLRNGVEAVRLAGRACELSGHASPLFEGTLAAAYAEAGSFPEALASAKEAVKLAQASGDPNVAARDQKVLEACANHQPWRQPASVSQSAAH